MISRQSMADWAALDLQWEKGDRTKARIISAGCPEYREYTLRRHLETLERTRLKIEGTFCHDSMSQAERRSRSEVSTSQHPPTRQFDLEQTRLFQRGCLCSRAKMSRIFWGALWGSLSGAVSGPTCVLHLRHGNSVHDQKFFAASLAFLPRHENVIEERGGSDSGFLLAVRGRSSYFLRFPFCSQRQRTFQALRNRCTSAGFGSSPRPRQHLACAWT